jgi:hypothetical protein
MENVSLLLKVGFVVTSLWCVFLFYKATQSSKMFLISIGIWMGIQLLIGLTDFYMDGLSMPPHFALLIVPPFIIMIYLFISKRGKEFIDGLSLERLTLLHSVRIPVEISLYFLFVAKAIPEVMTFEGRNFDILAGLTSPLVYYFGFKLKKIPTWVLMAWNIVCLVLVFNIVIYGILSANTPLQQFGFDQPNIAIAYFPFNWLPSVVVAIVIFSHFASLRLLYKQTIKK